MKITKEQLKALVEAAVIKESKSLLQKLKNQLPKGVKVLSEDEWMKIDLPNNNQYIWKFDKKDGSLLYRGTHIYDNTKYILQSKLPRLLYHGTTLAAAMKILNGSTTKEFNFSCNPMYSIGYAGTTLEYEQIPVAVLYMESRNLKEKNCLLPQMIGIPKIWHI